MSQNQVTGMFHYQCDECLRAMRYKQVYIIINGYLL